MISLICTVKNEADNIEALIASMLAQSLPPDEIVVNDNHSDDQTPAIVERLIAAGAPVRLVVGGHNIPSGRNNAIRHARGAIIASTDAGLTLDPRWLEELTAPLRAGQADVVGGFYRPAPRSLFELALAATNYRGPEEIAPERFLPFGQSVAFTRAAWERVGGYPEWASHCEDLIFDLALQRAGMRFAFAPQALVHFRPRESLAALWRQYRSYARGDGVAGLWPRRHAIRYATYLGGAALAAASARWPWLLAPLLAGGAAYCADPLRRLLRWGAGRPAGELLRGAALIPAIRVVGDLAKIVGYPAGVWRRLRSPELRRQIAEYGRNQGTREPENHRPENQRTREP